MTAAARRESLRDAQVALTRERILAGVEAVMRDETLEELSFKAVAEAAGVPERTIFRHFENKAALLEAFWHWIDRKMGDVGLPETEDQLIAGIEAIFPTFDQHAPLMNAALASKVGLELRLLINPQRQAALRAATAAACEGLPPEYHRRAAALAQVFYNVHAWKCLRDYQGLDGVESGAVCALGMRLVLDGLRRVPRPARARKRTRRRKEV